MLKGLLIPKSVLYLAVSAFALIVDTIIYLFLVEVNLMSLQASAAVGYAFGIAISYLMMSRKVFKEGWLKDSRLKEFILFMVSSIMGLSLTYFVIKMVVSVLGPQILLAKGSAVAVSFISVYFFRKHIVFKSR